jgi:uncharacterized protein (TIGR02246 family)
MTQTPTIEHLLAQWIDAFDQHDLDKHMELYTEDALLFGSVDVLQNGREAVRSYFKAVGPHVQVLSYPMPVVRQSSENFALTAGYVTFVEGTVKSPFRMTWALVKKEGNWRIAQHHGSPCRDGK